MRTKSGMNDELAPGQLFVTPASPWPSENLVLTCQIYLARVANFCASASLG
jgi:hypothetical protein